MEVSIKKTKNYLIKTAAFLALFIGLMSVFAGSKVLLGIDSKDYNILKWLVSYNVIFGIISIITAILIWQRKKSGRNLTFFILIAHFNVFLYLQFLSDTAATESVKAMIFRTTIWILITILSIVIPFYINKQQK